MSPPAIIQEANPVMTWLFKIVIFTNRMPVHHIHNRANDMIRFTIFILTHAFCNLSS